MGTKDGSLICITLASTSVGTLTKLGIAAYSAGLLYRVVASAVLVNAAIEGSNVVTASVADIYPCLGRTERME